MGVGLLTNMLFWRALSDRWEEVTDYCDFVAACPGLYCGDFGTQSQPSLTVAYSNAALSPEDDPVLLYQFRWLSRDGFVRYWCMTKSCLRCLPLNSVSPTCSQEDDSTETQAAVDLLFSTTDWTMTMLAGSRPKIAEPNTFDQIKLCTVFFVFLLF